MAEPRVTSAVMQDPVPFWCGGFLLRRSQDEDLKDELDRPAVARLATFAQKEGSDYTHVQDRGDGRYRRFGFGTSNGGVVVLPPEVDMDHSGEDFLSDITRSTVYFMVAATASFGAGTPDESVGGIATGYSWQDDGSGNLLFSQHNANGVKADGVRFTSGKRIAFRDATSFWGTLAHTNTADRTWTFPDETGEVLLKETHHEGKTLFVDSVFGSDSSAVRQHPSYPYLTIEAAFSAALAGDHVVIRPGTYTPSAASGTLLTIPDDVAVRAAQVGTVTISAAVSADAKLIAMGERSRLEDISLSLTASGHHSLVGVDWPGTTSQTAKLRTYTLTVDNSGASASGTSQVIGLHSRGTGLPDVFQDATRAGTVRVISAGNGVKRGLLVDTAAHTFNAHMTNFTASGASVTDAIGVEVNFAGAACRVEGRRTGGATQDIKQTAGSLTMSRAILVNTIANGSPFNTEDQNTAIVFSVSGNIPPGTTRFLRPGADPVTTDEIKLGFGRKTIAKALTIRARVGPGAGKTDTWTLRKNGADTGLVVSLTGTSTSGTFADVSVDYDATDDYSMKIETDTGSATEDPVLVVETFN